MMGNNMPETSPKGNRKNEHEHINQAELHHSDYWPWKDQGISTPLQAYSFGHMPMPRQYRSNHRSHHLQL
jgi:hypothetical protein